MIVAWALATALASSRPIAVTAAPPAREGVGRVQITADPDTAPHVGAADALKVVLGRGEAQVTTVGPPGAGPVRVVMAFDQSGSFKPFWTDAFKLARQLVADLPAGAQVRVLLFGVEVTDLGVAPDAAALQRLLADAEARGPIQGWTRLRSSVRDAVERAAADAPLDGGGLRQVVVFTDAGEESPAYTVDAAVAHAREHGARIDVIAFPTSTPTVARRLDEVQQLAVGTGGVNVLVGDPAATSAGLREVATAAARTWWVDLRYCGVPDGGATPDAPDTLTVEVRVGGAPRASSAPVSFRQDARGDALKPCAPAAPAAPEAVVAPPAPAPAGGWPWWWPLAALGALALLLLPLPLLLRRKPAPAPAPAPAPPPVAPAPVFAPVAEVGDPLARLPEVALERVSGPASAPLRARLNKRQVGVGAGPDAHVRLDVPQVSTAHATFEIFPSGAVYLTDAGSTNGTFVDGRRLASGERTAVAPGALIGFSRGLVYRLTRPDNEPQAPPPRPPPEAPTRHRTIVAPRGGPARGDGEAP